MAVYSVHRSHQVISDSQLDQMVQLLNATCYKRTEEMCSFSAENGDMVYDFHFDSVRNLMLIVRGKEQYVRLRLTAYLKFGRYGSTAVSRIHPRRQYGQNGTKLSR